MSIFKDISHLLHSNDCVILPNFGAFVLKSKSAYIENNEFFPPSKYVSYNSMLKDNDGLLAKFISEERKISYKNTKYIFFSQNHGLRLQLCRSHNIWYDIIWYDVRWYDEI